MSKKDLPLKQAWQVLLNNLYKVTLNGTTYRRTVPSKQFYVHQWNWDSATHALGLIHISEDRAFDELLALVSGQWANGLIAQITFNPQETKYFPGPKFWGTEKFAQGEILTSGITQPPLLAISVAYVYQHAKKKTKSQSFLKQILPAVEKYHHYLKTYRDPEDSGLVTVVHPWESGTDNSPRWDKPLKKLKLADIPNEVKRTVNRYRSDDKVGDTTHRPGLDDYYRYMYLVWLFKKWQWDYRKIVKDSPFAVKDVLFNAIWCRANEDLAQVFKLTGKPQKAKQYQAWAKQTRKALQNLWSQKHGLFTDLDVSGPFPRPITANTIATFTPLWAGAASDKILKKLLKKLTDPRQFWSTCPVATTALNSPAFELTRYWRGPTWPITNLFVIEGLNRYKQHQLRDELIQKTLTMIARNGFFEYFDPLKGQARPDQKKDASLGFGSFSWTAAIYLYLTYKYCH